MSTLTSEKATKTLSEEDLTLLLDVIVKVSRKKNYHFSDDGKKILKMLLKKHMSFEQVAEKLSISNEKVNQIYRLEVKRLMHFVESVIED